MPLTAQQHERRLFPLSRVTTVAELCRVWRARRSTRPAPRVQLQRRPDRLKPPQPTILRKETVRSIYYLEDRGLADFGKLNCIQAPDTYRHRDPVTGVVTTKKVDDKSPSHGV